MKRNRGACEQYKHVGKSGEFSKCSCDYLQRHANRENKIQKMYWKDIERIITEKSKNK